MWPLLLDDTTEVLEIDPGQQLVLEITVNAAANGSLVSIAEDVTDGPTRAGSAAVRVAGIDGRNRETLRWLAYLAERRT